MQSFKKKSCCSTRLERAAPKLQGAARKVRRGGQAARTPPTAPSISRPSLVCLCTWLKQIFGGEMCLLEHQHVLHAFLSACASCMHVLLAADEDRGFSATRPRQQICVWTRRLFCLYNACTCVCWAIVGCSGKTILKDVEPWPPCKYESSCICSHTRVRQGCVKHGPYHARLRNDHECITAGLVQA